MTYWFNVLDELYTTRETKLIKLIKSGRKVSPVMRARIVEILLDKQKILLDYPLDDKAHKRLKNIHQALVDVLVNP